MNDDLNKWEAVRHDPRAIQYIENPSKELLRYAINKSFGVVHDIKNIPEDIQFEIVENTPHAIAYIQNPTENVQEYILKNHRRLIYEIRNPCDKIKILKKIKEL